VISYPTSFFVDPNGKIVQIHPGEMDEQSIEEAIRSMLDK
jgi:glutathione peroxidase-family protein